MYGSLPTLFVKKVKIHKFRKYRQIKNFHFIILYNMQCGTIDKKLTKIKDIDEET